MEKWFVGDIVGRIPDKDGKVLMFDFEREVAAMDQSRYFLKDNFPFGKTRRSGWVDAQEAHATWHLKRRPLRTKLRLLWLRLIGKQS